MARSIHNKIYFSSFLLVSLICMMILNYFMNQSVLHWEQTYTRVVELSNQFNIGLVTEISNVGSQESFPKTIQKYQDVYQSCSNCHDSNPGSVFLTRIELLNNLHDKKLKGMTLRSNVHDKLNEIKESVKYIHAHHIAFFKNFLKRNIIREDAYIDSYRVKHSEKSAPQLQIIEQVVAIKNSISDIVETFHYLSSNESSLDKGVRFAQEIDRFYNAINTFESYSLDAQDGILVEELLDSGRIFEDIFQELIQIEKEEAVLVSKLRGNKAEITNAVSHVIGEIKTNTEKKKRWLTITEYLYFSFILCWILLMVYQGKALIRSLNFLTRETEKISSDYTHQITANPNFEQEFQTLCDALNNLAKNLNERILSLSREVTRRTKAETETAAAEKKLERAQKMEVVGLMASGVAHDLNNILSGITGYPEIMLLTLPQDSELRKPIQEIRESGLRAAAIVADLLTIARGTATTREFAGINTLVAEYLSSPEYQHLKSRYPDVECVQKLAADLPDISCSKIHIRKCIMNMIMNSVEAVKTSGEIRITTELFFPDEKWLQKYNLKEKAYIKLDISDTGSGIKKEDIRHIFEPFYTRKVMGQSGTGLGLALVWNTVQEHNGIITVKSDHNGSSFHLYLPVSENINQLTAGEKKPGSRRGHGEGILIVDDEIQLREIATSMLTILGYSPVSVESGEKAVSYLLENTVDLVVLDMLMPPGINGRQTYEQILRHHPGQKAIVASGFSESSDVKATMKLGASTFLKKPFSLDDLGQAVAEALVDHV